MQKYNIRKLKKISYPSLSSSFHWLCYQLLCHQRKTWLVVALSKLMIMLGRRIVLSVVISSTLNVDLEAKSLTWYNQKVLIGTIYCLDWAQVSPMRHQQGPKLPGALVKWEENTIKCQSQLNCKCIMPSSVLCLLDAKGF